MSCGKRDLIWDDASHLEEQTRSDDPAAFDKAWRELCAAKGILGPGGFGHRGTKGVI
jgi:CTP synthase